MHEDTMKLITNMLLYLSNYQKNENTLHDKYMKIAL